MAGRYNSEKHNRRSIRLKGYDYAQCGAYFITICAQNRECFFGNIVNGEMSLNDAGQVISDTWKWLSSQYNYVEIDQYVVMPNHFHGVLIITCRGGSRTALTRTAFTRTAFTRTAFTRTAFTRTAFTRTALTRTAPTTVKPLGRLIGAFKTVSTKQVNKLRNNPGIPIWHRNYYERIIRNENEMNLIRQYIIDNPLHWDDDENNPVNYMRTDF